MTVPNWLDEAASSIHTASDAVRLEREVSALEEARASLAAQIQSSKPLQRSADSGPEGWWAGLNATPQLFDAVEAAKRSKSESDLNVLLRMLPVFAEKLHTAMLQAWKAYASDRVGDASDLVALTRLLEGLDSVGPRAQDLAAALVRVNQATGQLPDAQSEGLLEDFDQALADLESALRPEGVRKFVGDIARGGAALNLLDEEVLAWLHHHGATNLFKVAAGAPVTHDRTPGRAVES